MTTAPIRWLAGVSPGLTWTTTGVTTTNFNSLAASSSISCAQIDNSTNLDEYLDTNFGFTPNATTTIASSTVALYLMILNQDATTYGDNMIGANTTGAVTPSPNYYSGITTAGVAVTNAQVFNGSFLRIVMPPARMKWFWIPG